MAKHLQQIVVFGAGPSDVAEEKRSLKTMASEINRVFHGEGRPYRIEVVTHEDVPPGMHPEGGQGLIEETYPIGEIDVLVAFFWRRFGTQMPNGCTRTEHEIVQALDHNKKVLIYFKAGDTLPDSASDTNQQQALSSFKNRLEQRGVLFQKYRPQADPGLGNAWPRVFADLQRTVYKLLDESRSSRPPQPAQPPRRRTSDATRAPEVPAAIIRKRNSPVSCFAASRTFPVRAEGSAELLGDVVLTFFGGIRGSVDHFDVRVTTNSVPVANRSGALPDTRALLLVDYSDYQAGQSSAFFWGARDSDCSYLFENVRIALPGSFGARSAQIVNIRGNVARLGGPDAPPSRALAYISVNRRRDGMALPISSELVQLGEPLQGLVVTQEPPDDSRMSRKVSRQRWRQTWSWL